MQRGDLVRVNLRHRNGATVWDLQPWKARAIIRERLPEGALVLVLEQVWRVEDPNSGASLVFSPASGITGWIVNEYLDEIPTDVEAV